MGAQGGVTLSDERPASSKKPYQEPTLHVYGDIRVLTQAVSRHTTVVDAMIPKRTH